MAAKEKVEASIKKQVKAEKQAYHSVMKLIEGTVTEEQLSMEGKIISTTHYEDVMTERAIGNLCGYPVCGEALVQTYNKKYHISTKTNKVYEITDRKNFCSNHCYRASKHFEKQISSLPLWSRDSRSKVNFTFLPLQNIRGLVGDEVVLSARESLTDALKTLDDLDKHAEISPEHLATESNDNEKNALSRPEQQETVSGESLNILQKTPVDVDEICDNISSVSLYDRFESNPAIDSHSPEDKSITLLEANTISHHDKQYEDKVLQTLSVSHSESSLCTVEDKFTDNARKKSIVINQKYVTKEPVSHVHRSKKHISAASGGKVNASVTSQTAPLSHVVGLMQQWVTVKTLEYLGVACETNNARTVQQTEVEECYSEMCKRAERLEKDLDSDDDEDEVESTRPLPDFKKLQEESRLFQDKVQACFTGKEVKMKSKSSDPSQEQTEVFLPPVDSQDQMLIRRKIVLDRLSSVIPMLLTPMRLSIQDISSEIRELVFTLSLNSQNILFKPHEWTLAGLVLIKLLSAKLSKVERALHETGFITFCNTLFKTEHSLDKLNAIHTHLLNKEYFSMQQNLT